MYQRIKYLSWDLLNGGPVFFTLPLRTQKLLRAIRVTLIAVTSLDFYAYVLGSWIVYMALTA